MEEKFSKQHWHLDKRVSVGTIVSIVVIALGGFASYKDLQADVGNKADKDVVSTIQQDVAVIKSEQKNISEDISEIKDSLKDLAIELRRQRNSSR